MKKLVLIPSLIRDKEDIGLLTQTIKSIPKSNYQIHVMVQGDRKGAEKINSLQRDDVNCLYNLIPMGKWGAIQELVKGMDLESTDYLIALMDGDYAFSGADLAKLTQPIIDGKTQHTIGNRDRIGLNTPGTDESLRIFVELYFNTLILLASSSKNNHYKPFDLQCGFQAIHGEIAKKIDFETLPSRYGGEAALFINSLNLGSKPISVDIKFHTNSPASFNLNNVFRGLTSIDLIRNSSQQIRYSALERCCEIYAHRVDDQEKFRESLGKYLNDKKFIFHYRL